ncbi:MAG: hypothetical protein ABWY05_11060 [Noviherbaspirillum sp.]
MACQPVVVDGSAIARTFWGMKWCANLKTCSDYAGRLSRGRSYVRNGAVLDLRVVTGIIEALVCGEKVYKVKIGIREFSEQAWNAILEECAGKVATLVELLQGRLSAAVMEVVTRPGTGLLPPSRHIGFICTCPDSTSMCTHVAAALYAVGNRLDSQPELLFLLRHVDPQDMVQRAARAPAADATAASAELDSADLSALFGIELDVPPAPVAKARKKQGGRLR